MLNKYFQFRVRRFLGVLFLCSLTCCLWLGNVNFTTFFSVTGQKVNAQNPNISKLVEQGVKSYRVGDFTSAIALWEKALENKMKPVDEIIVRENLARTYQQIGNMQKSIANWDKIIPYYFQIGNMKMLGRAKAEQAQVYNYIGQPVKALGLLCNASIATGIDGNNCTSNSALQIARSNEDIEGEIIASGILGDTYRLRGNYEGAVNLLEKSLDLAKNLNNRNLNKPQLVSSINNSLGNSHKSLALFYDSRAELAAEGADTEEAEKKFREQAREQEQKAIAVLETALKLAQDEENYQRQVQILQTLIPIYYRNDRVAEGRNQLQAGINLLEKLPQNRTRVYATLNLARFQNVTKDGKLADKFTCGLWENPSQIESLLKTGIAIAQKIEDNRAESFAQGQLGHFYECQRKYSQAKRTTEKARLAADRAVAPDSLYLWEWQTGRILKRQGNVQEAIRAYDKALTTLDSIRQDILTANRDIQFDFRDTIEPIYRDLVEMRLSLQTPLQLSSQLSNKSLVSKKLVSQNNNRENNNFNSVINTIDSLRLAELQNFFGNDCNINDFLRPDFSQRRNENERKSLVDTVVKDKQTAVISTVILEDKTAVILSLPGKGNEYDWYDLPRKKLREEVNQFRQVLQRDRDDYDTEPGENIYNWMIAPFEIKLKDAGIKKLVFIHDGILRSVPMAALYDGEKFLIEKYAIATTPSLKLTDTKPLNREALRILALGLSEKSKVNGRDLIVLDNVNEEIKKVTQTIPGKQLLNNDLTRENLSKALKEEVYSILHVATHGKFGTDPKNTYIVMGEIDKNKGENQILKFNELDRLIRQISRNTEPLEMLTLTACETAVGNNRSALGLAGIAVQAGAKTAIASLWAVDDRATAMFANNFYKQLVSNPQISKADALQAVKTDLLQGKIAQGAFTHPSYWSSFVLIGNWM